MEIVIPQRLQSPMFSEILTYEDIASDNYAKEYGGNITSMICQANGDIQRGYVFGYDSIGRLTNADYQSTRCSEANQDHKVSYAYDMMGNVSKIMRNGTNEATANDWQKMDYVTLKYNGNQLIHATDTVNGPNYPASLNNVPHFHDKNISGNEYTYDYNGNMTEDLNKGITNIQYNLLDLPYQIIINGNTLEYDYDAMGTKLREKDITSNSTTQTDYCGNLVYESGTPTILLTDNGYVTLSDSKYHFYYKDHEGNNRVIADQSNTVEQVNNYYPFGLSYNNDASTNANKYKYNGKELQTQNGLDWYDYGARFYDPELCQWHTEDPLCEKFYDVSNYMYCMNNPVNYIDILGCDGNFIQFDPQKDYVLLPDVVVTAPMIYAGNGLDFLLQNFTSTTTTNEFKDTRQSNIIFDYNKVLSYTYGKSGIVNTDYKTTIGNTYTNYSITHQLSINSIEYNIGLVKMPEFGNEFKFPFNLYLYFNIEMNLDKYFWQKPIINIGWGTYEYNDMKETSFGEEVGLKPGTVIAIGALTIMIFNPESIPYIISIVK